MCVSEVSRQGVRKLKCDANDILESQLDAARKKIVFSVRNEVIDIRV